MKLTATDLGRRGACEDGLERWRELFREEPVEITVAFCTQHQELDYDWAAMHLLPSVLQIEYERQCAPLWAEFEHQNEVLLYEYECQCATQRGEHQHPIPWGEHQHPIPLANYERQRAVLRAEYDRQRARLFGSLAERTP